MAKWIEIFITKKIGIFANIKFYTIENFFCKMLKKNFFFKDLDLFWEILLNQNNKYIKNFFKTKFNQKKKILFSLEIKKIFKKYLLNKPKIILNWKSNIKTSKKEEFQKRLWKSLNNFKKNNFKNYIKNFLINKKKKKRIFVINTNNISKFFMSFFNKLNKNFSIIMLNVTPLGILIKEKNNFENLNNIYIVKKLKKIIINPLLMYLAKVSINLIKMFEKKKINILIKKKNKKKTLLKNIQKDIILNKKNNEKIYKKDKSILINSCCSKYKEIEILYKNLIKILNKEKNIKFSDIVIVSEKIHKYFPYINSIFNKKKHKNNIPYTIMENYNNEENEFLNFIYKMFSLKDKKIKTTEVMHILNTNFIKKKYNIKNKEIKILEIWISDIFIKFGINEKIINKEYKYIGKENTWFYGLKKLLLGCITHNKKLIYKNYSSYIKVNYYNKKLIVKLINLIKLIKKWKKKFSKKKKLNEWKKILNSFIEEFTFYKKKEIKKNIKKLLNKIINSGIKIKYKKKICISKLKIIFKKLIKTKYFNKNIFLNSITFCNFNKIENINFKVIYLLGINYCKKKYESLSENFDLTYKKKNNEYYIKKYNYISKIILLIISAKKYFYISYTNNFNKNKNIKILEILINYISENYYFKKSLSKNIIKNKKNIIKNILKKYKEDISYKNYKKYKKYKKHKKNKKIIKYLNLKKHKKINIINLIKFWKSPIEYFLKNSVKINLFEYYKKNNLDEEPFVLTKNIENEINKKIFKSVLKKKNTKKIFKYYLSTGVVPKNNFGKIIFEEILKNSINLKKKIYKFYKKKKKKYIKIKIKNFIIYINIKITSSKKLIKWKPKILNLYDVIKFWFYHLIFCYIKKCNYNSEMFGYKNSKIIFKKLNKKKSYNYILKYIKGYFYGIINPIFLTKSGMIWIKNLINGKSEKKSKKEFIKNWNGDNYIFGEKNNYYIKKIIKKINKKNIKKIYNASLKWHYHILKNLKK